ncbi:MAG: O-antigen ligase family protein, partial [Lachnospiraceae bacterium]|nr:O-antigen ligase family protein [Lachnospiraceae bacterium]
SSSTVGVYLLVLKEGDNEFPKQVRIIAACFVAVCFLAVLLPFVYFSFIDKETDLGKLGKYLRLNDQWGTHRGYAWIRSIILFKDNGIKNMLIGSGPDTFGQIIKEKYRQDMIKRHGSVFDSAHHEYLNYLVTIGITGLVAYVTAMISVVVRGFKHCKKSLPLLIIVFVIICYNAQSMFNIAQPITTPFLFVFLGLGEALIRKFELEEKQQ